MTSSGIRGTRMTRTVVTCFCIAVFSAGLLSCSSTAPRGAGAVLTDGKYDTEFPTQPAAKYLTRIVESVLRLNSVVYYRTYFFGDQERVTRKSLTEEILRAHEYNAVYSSSSTSGTSTVIESNGRQIALLTCAHLVAYPDTVFSFLAGPEKRPSEFISSVSVQQRMELYVATLPEGGVLTLLAIDKEKDLAVVGRQFESFQALLPPPIGFPFGKSAELDWGTFVYLVGYPSGNKILTRALVSSPNKDHQQSFLVDAVFGRGFSGGICLALRDGIPNFEIVGMIKSVPAHVSYVLTPGRENAVEELDFSRPFRGNAYIDKQVDIEYGTSQALSAEVIVEFLADHKSELLDSGFRIEPMIHN
jgi:hypothetical protein